RVPLLLPPLSPRDASVGRNSPLGRVARDHEQINCSFPTLGALEPVSSMASDVSVERTAAVQPAVQERCTASWMIDLGDGHPALRDRPPAQPPRVAHRHWSRRGLYLCQYL